MWFKDAGPFAYWFPLGIMLLVGLGGLAVASWLGNKRFPPALALYGLFLGALAPLAAQGSAIVLSYQAVAHASAEMKQTLLAAGVSVSMLMHALPRMFLLLPALLFIVLASGAAAIRGPRRTVPPIAAVALGGVACLASVLGAFATESGYLNAPVYALATLAIAAGLSGAPSDDPETSNAGPTAAAAAALAFPILVALCETGTLAASQIQVFQAVAYSSAEMKASMLENGLMLANAGRAWSWLAIAASTGVALVGAGAAMNEDAGHNAGVMLGMAGAVAGALAFAVDAGPMFELMGTVMR